MRYFSLRRLVSSSLLLLALLLDLTAPPAHAQAPAWQRAVAASGDVSVVQATVADASGNIFVAGYFEGTLGLGSVSLVSAGGSDIFVAKWSTATNSFVWAQRAGGTGTDRAVAVAVSGSNVYLTGTFEARAIFGTTTLALGPNFSKTIFVAKLTDAGTTGSFGWAMTAGNPNDGVYGIAVSGSDVYLAGFFGGTSSFGTTTLTSAGSYDAFVAKLTDAGTGGNFVWAQRGGGPGAERGAGVAVNGSNVYLTGSFENTASFGTTSLTSVGGGDIYVAKLTDAGAAGSFVWAQRAGGIGSTTDLCNGLAVSGSNVYVSGNCSRMADFGATTLAGLAVGTGGFVTKLADAGPTGSFTWAVLATGPGYTFPSAVAVSGANVYVSGFFSQSTTFGTTTLASVTGTDYDVFLAKLLDAGTSAGFAWALRAGGAGNDEGTGVVVSGGTVYVGGDVSPPASFGTLAVATPTTNNVGFLASVRDAVLPTRTAAELAGVSLFPNPVHAATAVHLPAVPGTAIATLTLCDALGRAVRTQQVALPAAGATAEVSLAGLAPGLYRVQVQAGGQQASQALVVE